MVLNTKGVERGEIQSHNASTKIQKRWEEGRCEYKQKGAYNCPHRPYLL